MYLREFSIGNFKAFGPTQTLPLKPLTLIYGPNSGGKSSLIHGLLYASEVQRFHAPLDFRSRSLDVHQTELGGDAVDLGGFGQFVFRRDIGRQVTVGFGLDRSAFPEDGDLPPISGDTSVEVEIGPPLVEAKLGEELRASGPPLVRAYRIGHAGNPLVTFGLQGGSLRLSQLAISSPVMAELAQYLTAELTETGMMPNGVLDKQMFELMGTPGFFAYGDSLLPRGVTSCERPIMDAYTSKPVGIESGDDQSEPWVVIRDFLNVLLLKYHAAITNELSTLDYLGPLRSYPPRRITDLEHREPGPCAQGASDWQLLISDEKTRDTVNKWLGTRMLTTPYELRVRQYYNGEQLLAHIAEEETQASLHEPEQGAGPGRDIDENTPVHTSESVRSAMDKTSPIRELILVDRRTDTEVTHRDIGIGVSQVLPVLVAAYAGWGITAIEQPEIHLHPALQAELGDVFIESAAKQGNTFILETHSEHLLLRILRRIRETTEGKLPEGAAPITTEDVQVVYVEPTKSGSRVLPMELDEDGQLVTPWPGGFFEEGFRERFGA